jgi:hypothetical protein
MSVPLFLGGQLILLDLAGDEYITIDTGGSVDVKTTTIAIAALAAGLIEKGVIVEDVFTTSAATSMVPGLPVIPTLGGYCLLQGTITAQDQNSRSSIAMWNIALLVTGSGGTCETQGDTTPSLFVQTGTLASLSAPALSAGASGPVINLTGLAGVSISWGINLNSTTGN